MKFLLALVLAFLVSPSWAVVMTQRNCSWDHPGANPYVGSIDVGIDYYIDIPSETRELLKGRIKLGLYDEIVDITKYGISGKSNYGETIGEMHFGRNHICTTVTRTRWPEDMVQKATVYCEGKHCVIIPFICGNISRIKKLSDEVVTPKLPGNNNFLNTKPTPVPEPSSVYLMIIGLVALVIWRKKKFKKVL